VRQFVQRESRGVSAYVDELEGHAPFRHAQPADEDPTK
jgi:predicted N-acyltransferase